MVTFIRAAVSVSKLVSATVVCEVATGVIVPLDIGNDDWVMVGCPVVKEATVCVVSINGNVAFVTWSAVCAVVLSRVVVSFVCGTGGCIFIGI